MFIFFSIEGDRCRHDMHVKIPSRIFAMEGTMSQTFAFMCHSLDSHHDAFEELRQGLIFSLELARSRFTIARFKPLVVNAGVFIC